MPPDRVMLADLPDRVRRVGEACKKRDELRLREELRLLARDAALLANSDPFPFPTELRSVERRQELRLQSKAGGFTG